jgi:lysozyme family protein
MADFGTALLRVLRWEGGFQVHTADRGNYNSKGQLVGTNWGIAAPVYERWLGRVPTKKDVKDMSKNEAGQIYRGLFWVQIRGDEIQNQFVADILFDGHVNHGGTGIRLMQRILNVEVDGKVGPITLAAINMFDPEILYKRYKEARRLYYHRIVEKNPMQQVFLKGWLRRIDSFEDKFPAPPVAEEPNSSNDPPGE